jgi:hypothetical protein
VRPGSHRRPAAALARSLTPARRVGRIRCLRRVVSSTASKQAPPAKPAPEAQSVSAKNGSRLLVSGFAQVRFTNPGAQNGDRPPGNVTDFQVTRFRPRLTYQLDPKHCQALILPTQLEYLWGRAFGADLNGGYGQIIYNTGQPGNLFARQDVFDPNTHAAHDDWSRTTLGWSKDFTRQFRLTLEYDLVTNRALPHPHPNTFGIQTQANF